jgi:hypothetical protein
MDTPDRRPRQERDETDKTLQAERTKTDDQLGKVRIAVEHEADQVLQIARGRAEATLQSARDRTDLATHVTPSVQAHRDEERAREDCGLAEEHATADELLRAERNEKERALHALLRWERASSIMR